jgi:hypothetical protein
MEDGVNWQKECEKWLTPTAPYTRKDLYRKEEINTELYQEVKEIIESTKGPYPAFHKKMKLTDLLTIVR